MIKKEWKYIKGYNKKYQISNYGEIRSLNYHNQPGVVHLLHLETCKKGYLRVTLSNKCKTKRYLVHRLVAEYFCEKPKNWKKLVIDHIDTNTSNNICTNLRFCTQSSNMIDNGITVKKRQILTRNQFGGVTYIKCIETGEIHTSREWRELGYTHAIHVAEGHRKHSRGLHFYI